MSNTPSFKVESVTASTAMENQQVVSMRYNEKNEAVGIIKNVITSVYGLEIVAPETVVGPTLYSSPEVQTVQQTTSNVNNPLLAEQARLATDEAFKAQESING